MQTSRPTTTTSAVRSRSSRTYARLEELLARGDPVILDGGNATELERAQAGELRDGDRGLWGTGALYDAPYAVLDIHRAYVAAGCDVISTNTWAILAAAEVKAGGAAAGGLTHWMDVARLGIRVAREAVAAEGRTDSCAIAFSVNGDVEGEERLDSLRLLTRVLDENRPDLLLLETMSLLRPETTRAVEIALGTGLPVWLSFRRCRHGVCGVFGQHWGGPEGDLFGRAAQQFEEMGVSALLVNCLPPEHVDGMLPWLRDFTDLPLGAYPNLGYYSDAGWRHDERIGPDEYAELALRWRSQGAQIVGGCCGTTPAHIEAVEERLAGTKPGTRRGDELGSGDGVVPQQAPTLARPWVDDDGRRLYPLPFPELELGRGVFVPTVGSLLVWKHLLRNAIGARKNCLDVGCGSGLLAIQLARNGADHVHAVDIEREAVATTLANAYRNGVAERVTASEVDLYMLEPEQRYDVVVASLYQMPVDPYEQYRGHRPLDYWGRNLVDHLIGLLPRLLADRGVAYVMQLSILSQLETTARLEAAHLDGRVVDFGFFPFSDSFERNRAQIERVEELSDAYHLRLADDDVMVAYLLEIERRSAA